MWIHAGCHIWKSFTDIRLLRIIDMNPSDRSCILSALLFIIDQGKLLNMETPCVTFDQPRWIKAIEVTKAEFLNVVCRLGVFHLIMSFLGQCWLCCMRFWSYRGPRVLLRPKHCCTDDAWQSRSKITSWSIQHSGFCCCRHCWTWTM